MSIRDNDNAVAKNFLPLRRRTPCDVQNHINHTIHKTSVADKSNDMPVEEMSSANNRRAGTPPAFNVK
jgi:hypothetical protein